MESRNNSDRKLPEKRDPSNTHPSLEGKSKEFILFCKVQGAMRFVPDFAETCKAILNAVMEEMDAENCSLMLKDPTTGELSIRVARGKNERESVYYPNHSSNWKNFKPGEGIAGSVLREGRAIMVGDVREEPRFVSAAGLNSSVRSLICYPIKDKDQVVGVFNLSHSKAKAFSEGHKMALAYVSNQVGAALTSARFFLEIQEMDRLLKDSGESFSRETPPLPPVPKSSTFVEVGEVYHENEIFIYASDKMHRIKEMLDQVANTDVTILIQGESGVGKEVVARSIHLNSSRQYKPFVKVNCAALPQELIESELFGYEKGAFTGAYRPKPGKFELAHGGTIFLDEIAEISLSLQAKLLQVLQDGEFSRLGGKRDVRVDVRVLVATNRNIDEAVRNGSFREDLYYRLNVVNITVPPLRERKEEIPVLIEYFLDKFQRKYSRKVSPPSAKLMNTLLQHRWAGNVRELENVIQRLVVLRNEEGIIEELSPGNKLDSTDNKLNANLEEKDWPSLKEAHHEAVVKAESDVIRRALELTNWNRKKAAAILNISYKALLYKIKTLGIDSRHRV
ncbi:MAG: sigma 54-interacting transcriptional regulator [Deltaproteobacteria bacterium]